VVNATSRLLYARERDTVQSAGWASMSIGKGPNNLTSTEIRTPEKIFSDILNKSQPVCCSPDFPYRSQ
jgi:hypothetical protein